MSLKVKFSLYITVLIFAILASISIILISIRTSEIRAQLSETDRLIASSLIESISDDFGSFYAYQFDQFASTIQNKFDEYPEILGLRLLDTNGQVVFDSVELTEGKYDGFEQRMVSDPHVLELIKDKKASQEFGTYKGQSALFVYVPFIDRYDTYRSMGQFFFSLDRVNQVVLNMSLLFVILFGVFLLIGGIFNILLIRRITRPLEDLTHVAGEIEKGHLDKRAKVESKDEVGLLAETFNKMTSKLLDLNRDLEKKVQEKTADLAQKVDLLEQSNAQDEAILDSIGEAMITTDHKGDIVLMNKVAEGMFGIKLSETKGKKLTGVLVSYDEKDKPIPEEDRIISKSLKTGKREHNESHYMRPDQKKFVASVTAAPIRLEHKVYGVVVIFRDITKEKEIDRMKTEFISLASHQLRTPLSAIKWFAEMLQDGDAGKLKAEQMEFVKNITQSTERMIELVNSLLNISRIESGRIIVDPKPTDLKELIEGLVKELQVKTIERKQTLIVSVNENLPKINLDPKLIRQVYLNLLTNAIKYTPKGGEISVLISRKDEEVISQVTDNGYGIPKAEQAKVFQKFFRAGNVAKVETDGTGLGLYLIKAIIESSKGRIWFESKEGKGTTFWFTLPLKGMKAKEGEVSID
jgi:PAS domain S-box-containing protein